MTALNGRRPADAPALYAMLGGSASDEQPPQDDVELDDAVGTELERVEVADGELVDDEEIWLPPILPAWATDLELFRAKADVQARVALYYLARHGLRLPLYGWRLTARTIIGIGRGAAALWGWVFDFEARPLRQQAVASGETRDYVVLRSMRDQSVKVRGTVALATLAAAAAGIGVEGAYAGQHVAAAPWLKLALATQGLAAVGIAAWNGGRYADDDPIVDEVEVPLPLDLNVEHLNEAFRAAGLLKGKDEDEDAPRLIFIQAPMRDSAGSWTAVFDLPRGGGKTAADALAKRDVLAAELGVDEIQLDLKRVRSAQGGHGRRLSLWLCDDDPYLGAPCPSPLEQLEAFDIWQEVPIGQDARGVEVKVRYLWESAFYGGLMRRGKTAGQRLPVSAGVLDPTVKHYVADGKGGSDWKPMEQVAHRYVLGAEPEAIRALEAMLDEAIDDMEKAYAKLRRIPLMSQPDAKLTPDICRRHGIQLTMITIDELQEYLSAISDNKRKDALIERLCRLARRGPAIGIMCNFASQRPDADSVPAKLRDIISIRACTQVMDRVSSDMVLGKGRAAQGADASILSEEHKGVVVLSLGADRQVIVKHDYMDLIAFNEVCRRGRALRIAAGTLSGDATDDILAGALNTIPPVLADVLTVMRHLARIHTSDLLNRLVNYDDTTYGTWTPERLAAELDAAGVVRSTNQVKIDGANRNGYHKSDLLAAAEIYEPADA